MFRTWTILAAIFGATGVAVGAFGAHRLVAHFAANSDLETTFGTAVQYHLVHTLALLGAAWVSERYPGRWARVAGWPFALGILFFSGALYILSIFSVRIMGAIAPIGGLAFDGGWVCLGVAAWKGREEK